MILTHVNNTYEQYAPLSSIYVALGWFFNNEIPEPQHYLFANCTNPHPFPAGILMEITSPNGMKECLSSTSVTSESSPPTNIYNKQRLMIYINFWQQTSYKQQDSQLCLMSHFQIENLVAEHHWMHNHQQVLQLKKKKSQNLESVLVRILFSVLIDSM